jgi:hypothetical protein
MINANELRRGNIITYIKNNEKEQVIVTVIMSTMIACKEGAAEFEHFEPIPISEDWLLKFGFAKCGNLITTQTIKAPKIGSFSLLLSEGKWFFVPNVRIEWSVEITHVHQLQNLYFALTGEELKIKE